MKIISPQDGQKLPEGLSLFPDRCSARGGSSTRDQKKQIYLCVRGVWNEHEGVRLINPLAVDSQRNANNKMGSLVKENRKFYGKSGGKIRNLMPYRNYRNCVQATSDITRTAMRASVELCICLAA